MQKNNQNNQEKENKSSKIKITVIVVLVVMFILLLLKLWSCATNKPQAPVVNNPTVGGLTVTDGEEEDNTNSLASRSVYFSGFDDVVVNSESKIRLRNLPENEDFLMKYEVYNGSDLIYSTDLITSGNSVYWTIGETLSAGEYTLTFKQIPYVQANEGFMQLTFGSCSVKVTVVD